MHLYSTFLSCRETQSTENTNRRNTDRDREAKAVREARQPKKVQESNQKKRTRPVQFTITLGDGMLPVLCSIDKPATEQQAEPKGKRQKRVTASRVDTVAPELSNEGLSATATPFQPSTAPKAQRCAFFPSCTRAECPYFHPTEPCKHDSSSLPELTPLDCFRIVHMENCADMYTQLANLGLAAAALVALTSIPKSRKLTANLASLALREWLLRTQRPVRTSTLPSCAVMALSVLTDQLV